MEYTTVADTFKASLAELAPDTIVRIELGSGGSVVQLSVADLAKLLGVTLNPKPVETTPKPGSTGTLTPTIHTKRVRVNGYDYIRIRLLPSVASEEVGRYDKSEVFEIIDGTPIQAEGHMWYLTVDKRGYVAGDLTISVDAPQSIPITTMNVVTPTSSGWTPAFTASMRGVGASAGGWSPDKGQLELVQRNRIESVYICAYEANQAAKAIPAFKQAGVKQFILRAAIHEPLSLPDRFLQITTPILSEYAKLLGTENLMIAVHNEPNLYKEGLGSAWRDGAVFADWFLKVADALRHTFAGARIGFPALSPGGDVPNIRLAEATFLAQAVSGIQAADWIGVHYYWANPNGSDINPPVAQWRQWYGTKPIIGTEVGPTDANTITADAMRIAYSKFAEVGVPAIGWVLNGAGAWHNAAWDTNAIYL